jgi:hypothetical protein
MAIISVFCFLLKIFRYLDTIVVKHNKILDLVGLNGKNKYNCLFLFFGEAFDPSPKIN